jgi:hypothetical protein
MPRSGPKPDSINVNIILHNQLEPLLRTWYAQRVKYSDMADRINTLIAEEAAKSGAPPARYSDEVVRKWCQKVYGLGEPR